MNNLRTDRVKLKIYKTPMKAKYNSEKQGSALLLASSLRTYKVQLVNAMYSIDASSRCFFL